MNKDTAPWLTGIALIALGLIFLFQNHGLSLPLFDHWWALFILIPAFGAWMRAYQMVRLSGYWTSGAVRAAFGGCAPALVAVIFLFDLSWSKVWPLFIVLAGIDILLSRKVSEPTSKPLDPTAVGKKNPNL
ncbi:MAG: hypothetical protein U0Z75_08260 [Deinococcaceae bacterium]